MEPRPPAICLWPKLVPGSLTKANMFNISTVALVFQGGSMLWKLPVW